MNDIDILLKKHYKEEMEIPAKIDMNITYFIYNYEVDTNINRLSRLLIKFLQIILILFGLTGVVVAGTAVITNNSKTQTKSINSTGLLQNDRSVFETMEEDSKYNIYYKAIDSFEEYKKFKGKVELLPDIEEEFFNEHFVLLITWINGKTPYDKHLSITDIKKEGDITYVTCDNTNEKKDNNNIIYNIGNKKDLGSKVKIDFKEPKYNNEEYKDIEELRKNYYSQSEAKEDGCIVTFNSKLQTDNEEKVYEFLEKSRNGEEAFLRIYKIEYSIQYPQATYTHLIDIYYKDNLYNVSTYNVNNNLEEIKFETFEKIENFGNSKTFTGWSENYTEGGIDIFCIGD